ncbi:hypothetical protein C8F01DRAFT_1142607 [Mycena amicta]|nr:hypothetical protein C8F01DRAFT_1142607 [Mycena amicta]
MISAREEDQISLPSKWASAPTFRSPSVSQLEQFVPDCPTQGAQSYRQATETQFSHVRTLDRRKSLVYAMEGYWEHIHGWSGWWSMRSCRGRQKSVVWKRVRQRTSHAPGGKKTLLRIGRRRVNEYEATDPEPPSPSISPPPPSLYLAVGQRVSAAPHLHSRFHLPPNFARLPLADTRRLCLRGTRIHDSAPHRVCPAVVVTYILPPTSSRTSAHTHSDWRHRPPETG